MGGSIVTSSAIVSRQPIPWVGLLLGLACSPLYATPLTAQQQAAPAPILQGPLAPARLQSLTLAPPARHRWSVEVGAGEYVEVTLVAHRIDLHPRVLAPSGDTILDQGPSVSPAGAMTLRWLAPVGGRWSVEVAGEQRRPGGYDVRLEALRPPTARDLSLLAADSLTRLAHTVILRGRYERADTVLRAALSLYRQTLGPDDAQVAWLLNDLATVLSFSSSYDEMERLYRQALAIQARGAGPRSLAAARVQTNLAVLLSWQGRYPEADSVFRSALAAEEAELGRDGVDFGLLNDLARLNLNEGEVLEAERLLRRALSRAEQPPGRRAAALAALRSDLGAVLVAQGRYAEAEAELRRARTGAEAILPTGHPLLAEMARLEADLYERQGRWTEAEPVLRRVLEIMRRDAAAPPEGGQRESWAARNLAELLLHQGRAAEAEPLLRRSVAIDRRILGGEHPGAACSLTDLASALLARGRPADARPLLDSALAIFDAIPLLTDGRAQALALRGRTRRAEGDTAGGLEDLTRAIDQLERERPRIGGAEGTLTVVWTRHADLYERMVDWLLEAGDVARAFEYAERGRARALLDQLAAARVDLRSSVAPAERMALERREGAARVRIAGYQQRLTFLLSSPSAPADDRARHMTALVDSLRAADRDYQAVYAAIRNASPLWREVLAAGHPIALRDVQRRLVLDSGLMLIYHVGSERSAVFAIGRDRVDVLPLVVAPDDSAALGLPPGALTAGMLTRLMNGTSTGAAPGPGVARALRRVAPAPFPAQMVGGQQRLMGALHALWRVLVPSPLWERVRAASNVVIVPGRGLFLLPFESLVVRPDTTAAGATFWLDVGPPVRYAPSATALAALQRAADRPVPSRSPTRADVLSLSNPVFDPVAVQARLGKAGVPAPATGREGGWLKPLPGSAAESEAIRAAFAGGSGHARVVTLLGLQATEARLRASLPGARYLHLATHALVDQTRDALFAGLVLTPPSKDDAPPANDGFLQLHEIYQLALPRLDLAVLSGCDTNAGPAGAQEGEFALSRGFLAAGARRVIASQWMVEDSATAALIGQLFARVAEAERRQRSPDFASALRDAKLAIRRQGRWAHPYYWAPLVLTGLD